MDETAMVSSSYRKHDNKPKNGWHKLISRLSYEISRLEPGPKAQLRRGPLKDTESADFWRLHNLLELSGCKKKWALVMQGMAIMTPAGSVRDSDNRQSAHNPRRKLGTVLAQPSEKSSGLSELRLQRLLKAKNKTFDDLTMRTCRMLAAKSASCDWIQFASLIFHRDKIFNGQTVAQQIAKDYFNTLFRMEKTKSDPTEKEN